MFKNLFCKKPKRPDPEEVHKQRIINIVIKTLEQHPEQFTARWVSDTALESSVRTPNGSILVMIKTGEIIRPLYIEPPKKQAERIKQLIVPIVKKDSDYLVHKFLTKFPNQ